MNGEAVQFGVLLGEIRADTRIIREQGHETARDVKHLTGEVIALKQRVSAVELRPSALPAAAPEDLEPSKWEEFALNLASRLIWGAVLLLLGSTPQAAGLMDLARHLSEHP